MARFKVLRTCVALLFLNAGVANANNNEYKFQSLERKIAYFYIDQLESIAKEIIFESNQLKCLDNFFSYLLL